MPPTTRPRPLPTAASSPLSKPGFHFSLARIANGAVWAWGNNSYGQLGVNSPDNGPHITPVEVDVTSTAMITAGNNHVLALTPDATLVGWGQNFEGELG